MKPKKPARATSPFGPEPKTAPSPSSGAYRARPVIVEEVAPHASQMRRRASVTSPALRRDEPSSDEAVATPRPKITLDARPRVVKYESELEDLPLEPRAAFLLGLVDGRCRVQTLVDVSGMDEQTVIEILERLLVFGVIRVDR